MWIGAASKGYYEEKWQILDRDGLVAEEWHPFVPKDDGVKWIWARFKLRSSELTAGKYRVRIFLNGEQFEDKELVLRSK